MKLKYLIPILGFLLAWWDYEQVQINSNGDLEHKIDFFNVVVALAVTILFIFWSVIFVTFI